MSATHMTIGIVGGLALFLFGMKIMSEGLQKVAGEKMRTVLSAMTSNRLLGVGTGVLVTSAVQSSSATTVMLVGFVHAGLITLNQSIGVIMGANIGTTFTGWLVAIVGFKVHIAAMALPSIALGFFARFLGSRRLADWGEVLVGFGILFLGLDFMKEAVSELRSSEAILAWLGTCRADTLGARLFAVGVGMVVTFIIQSSSAAMAVTMTLAAEGMIDLPTACALAIGQNIGTTITANIAAVGTSTEAKQAARAHMLFNVLGSIWPVLVFSPFLTAVDWFMPGHEGGPEVMSQAAIAARLAAFHTAFNVINTIIFLPFTNQLAWMATKLTPQSAGASKHGLRFLDPKVMNSPPMALHAVRGEMQRMLAEVDSMLVKVLRLIANPQEKLGRIADEILVSEQTVDMLEKEISEYLSQITRLETSDRQSHEILGLQHAVHDIERMGDHCEALLKLVSRRYDKKLEFSDLANKEIQEIGDRTREFLELLRKSMAGPDVNLMVHARHIEQTINEMRWRMRKGHVKRLNEGSCVLNAGLVFIDMLTSFEKIGDHSFNVAQVLAGER